MTEAGSCKTLLLDDFPSDEDEFGAHRRVAEAIAEVVRTENGGRTIGLEGEWGAGKSTVVRLLNRELETDVNTAVWVFRRMGS